MNLFIQYHPLQAILKKYAPVRTLVLLMMLFVASQSKSQSLASHTASGPFIDLFNDTSAYADLDTIATNPEEDLYFDEVLLTLNIIRIGSFEIEGLVYNDRAYLPVHALFDFLKIRNSLSPDVDSVSGFFIHPGAPYLIDKSKNRIIYEGKILRIRSADLIRTEKDLYLRTEYFGKIFGLDCVFDFRSLSVMLNSKTDLPVIREMQQEAMRQNINRFRGEKKADTSIVRKASFIHLGVADWSVISSQQIKGLSRTTASLDLGAMVAGGETNIYLNYNSNIPLNLSQQYFRWRHVNNNSNLLSQVVAGRILPQSISSIYRPVNGIQFTNTPSTNRKSFGTYTLSNRTEPGWMVELYMNDMLIDYTKSDASGFYTFEVPMVYGNTVVKLRFYGPWGEEKTEQQFLNIPFNFVPLHKLEYSLSAGIVDDGKHSRFSRASFNYGLSRRITVGGGNEYLSSLGDVKNIPFVNASFRIASSMFLTGEHSYGVRSKWMLNYKMFTNVRVDLEYTKYEKDQKAIRLNYLDEKKLMVSMPIRGKKLNAFTRLSVNQVTIPSSEVLTGKTTSKYTNAEYLISASYKGIGLNATNNAVFTERNETFIYTNLALTARLPKGFLFRPQAQYDYRNQNLSFAKVEFEKYLSYKGFLNIFYEESFLFKTSFIGVGFRYNFSFGQTSFTARKNNKTVTLAQSASGSLLYNESSKKLSGTNMAHTGRGAILVLPFLDLNCNGTRDAGEPKVAGLKLGVNGGRISRNEKDTTITISGLEAYNSYYLELDKNSFDNIAWQIRNRTIKLTADPNYFQTVEVPVAVVGEVSGYLTVESPGAKKGQGRMLVNIYNSKFVLVAKTVTENDGFFSYLGLPPGEYTIAVDELQLKKLKMSSSAALRFTIAKGRDGDFVDGLKFTLSIIEEKP